MDTWSFYQTDPLPMAVVVYSPLLPAFYLDFSKSIDTGSFIKLAPSALNYTKPMTEEIFVKSLIVF